MYKNESSSDEFCFIICFLDLTYLLLISSLKSGNRIVSFYLVKYEYFQVFFVIYSFY